LLVDKIKGGMLYADAQFKMLTKEEMTVWCNLGKEGKRR
jgi:hypothetical protein